MEKLTEIKILAKTTVLIFVYNFDKEKWKINGKFRFDS
jgi:hypothetical protein